MRRSIVLSLPLQLVFPVYPQLLDQAVKVCREQTMDILQLTGQNLAQVPTLDVAKCVYRCNTRISIKRPGPSLELKIRSKQLLFFVLLASALLGQTL